MAITRSERFWRDVWFSLALLRNGAILAGLYFFSVWATGSLTLELVKPILIFLGSYVLIELSKYYGLEVKRQPFSKSIQPMISVF